MPSQLYEEVLNNFDNGMAPEAARVLLKEAARLSTSEDATVDHGARLARSDEFAKLAVKLHELGADTTLQAYRVALSEQALLENNINATRDQLLAILEGYVDVFQRLMDIVNTPIARIQHHSNFERIVRKMEPPLMSQDEVDAYLIEPVRAELNKFIGYAQGFGDSTITNFTRRSIKLGHFHTYAALLFELDALEARFAEIEPLQMRLKDLVSKRQPAMHRPRMTENEQILRASIQRTLG